MRNLKHITKFNESQEPKRILKDLIGDITRLSKNERGIWVTSENCFSNVNLGKIINWEYSILYSNDLDSKYELCHIRVFDPNDRRGGWGCECILLSQYDSNGKPIPKILSTEGPGDPQGEGVLFDMLIAWGHDGVLVWNIKTGELGGL